MIMNQDTQYQIHQSRTLFAVFSLQVIPVQKHICEVSDQAIDVFIFRAACGSQGVGRDNQLLGIL